MPCGSCARRIVLAHSGQNPIEAVKLGAGVITGPNWHNFEEPYRDLLVHSGCRQVANANELATTMDELLSDPAALGAMRRNARGVILGLSGALKLTLAALAEHLPAGTKQEPSLVHAS